MHDLTAVSLFSGVGGLDEGLRRAGFRHLLMCESDGYRRDVLRARFPGVPVADDVRGVCVGEPAGRSASDPVRTAVDDGRGEAGTGLPGGADLLCGGFPCQDLSVAGNRAGLAGERSGLFFEYARIADALQPRWLLVENVPGLLSSNGGRDFGIVLGTLADLGYGLGWRILDSRYFGVPQRRRRVFIVGARANGDPRAAAERAGQVLAVGTRCRRHPPAGGEAGADVAGTLGGGSGERGWAQDTKRMTFVADTVRSHPRPGSNSNGNMIAAPLASGSHPNSNAPGRRKEDDENLVAFNWRERDSPYSSTVPALDEQADYAVCRDASVRRLTPVECERLQAFPDGWTDLGSTADSKRYAALGDAVTVTVAEWIGRRIVYLEGASCPSAESRPRREGYRGVCSATGARQGQTVKPVAPPNDPGGSSPPCQCDGDCETIGGCFYASRVGTA